MCQYDIEIYQKIVWQIMELGDPPHLRLSKKSLTQDIIFEYMTFGKVSPVIKV